MIKGVELFKTHFQDYKEQHVMLSLRILSRNFGQPGIWI